MNKPLEITKGEWKEIIQIPLVRLMYNLRVNCSVKSFSSKVFGVKFELSESSTEPVSALYLITCGKPNEQNAMIKRDRKGHVSMI